MAKTESTLVNMILALLIITAIAGGTLGMVYKVTKKPISDAKLNKQKAAIEEVVPGFDNNPTEEMYYLHYIADVQKGKKDSLQVFPCKKDDRLIGVAISTKTERGFSGEIKIMVGLKPDGTIINYSVLEHKETPGLGSKMQEWFRPIKVAKKDKPQRKSQIFEWFFGKEKVAGGDNSIIGKNPENTKMIVKKDGGEIDAITAATISSRAFLDAIMIAYNTYKKEGGKK